MIDTWLKNDLQDIYEQPAVAGFIDESGDAEFTKDASSEAFAKFCCSLLHSGIGNIRFHEYDTNKYFSRA